MNDGPRIQGCKNAHPCRFHRRRTVKVSYEGTARRCVRRPRPVPDVARRTARLFVDYNATITGDVFTQFDAPPGRRPMRDRVWAPEHLVDARASCRTSAPPRRHSVRLADHEPGRRTERSRSPGQSPSAYRCLWSLCRPAALADVTISAAPLTAVEVRDFWRSP